MTNMPLTHLTVLDLTAPAEEMRLPDGVDVVIHTAAHFGGKSPAEIQAAEDVNVMGTLKLCQASVRAKVQHFVFISTIFEPRRASV